jgi:hypothetical protein
MFKAKSFVNFVCHVLELLSFVRSIIMCKVLRNIFGFVP